MAAIHEGFHQEDIVAPRRLDDGHSLGVVEREGLLTQDMLAGLGGLDRPLRVLGMGGGDVDGLDIRVGQQRIVAAVATWDVEGVAESIGGRPLPAAHGGEHAAVRSRDAAGERLSDVARAQDAPRECFAHDGPSSPLYKASPADRPGILTRPEPPDGASPARWRTSGSAL